MKKPEDIYFNWIYFAEQDLNFAKLGYKDNFYSHVCFLSQQVIEKSCKAFLIFKKINYPKTHKIIDIINYDRALFSLLKNNIENLKIIDTFYIPTRYPEGIPGSLKDGLPGKDNAEECLELAEDVLTIIKKELKLDK